MACVNEDLELQFHYKVHTALDIVEEKLLTAGKSSGDLRELLLGLLYSTEELQMYPLTNERASIIDFNYMYNKYLTFKYLGFCILLICNANVGLDKTES